MFQKAFLAMVAELVGGAGNVLDGSVVKSKWDTIGVMPGGLETTAYTNACKRALTETPGFHSSIIDNMLSALVGTVTSTGLRLDRSGATRFIFIDTNED